MEKKKKLDWMPFGMVPLPITFKCWESEEYRKKFLNNPKQTFIDEGYEFLEGTRIFVYDNKNLDFHFGLPEIPKELIGVKNVKEHWDGSTGQGTCAATGTCD